MPSGAENAQLCGYDPLVQQEDVPNTGEALGAMDGIENSERDLTEATILDNRPTSELDLQDEDIHYEDLSALTFQWDSAKSNEQAGDSQSMSMLKVSSDLQGFGLDDALVDELLQRSLDCFPRLGLLSIVPYAKVQMSRNLFRNLEDLPRNGVFSPDLLYGVLAIALEFGYSAAHAQRHNEKALLVDVLRIAALKNIPISTWESRSLMLTQALTLVLLSHVWCMQTSLVRNSQRWNSLAALVWTEVQQSGTILEIGLSEVNYKYVQTV